MEAKSKLWYFENFSMMDVLSKNEKEMLDKKSLMRTAPKNKVIYFPEDTSSSIYLLKTGRVKISKIAPDGREIVLTILEPGEIFGEMSVTGQQKREEFAEATDETLLCIIDVADLQMMMEKNSKFNMQITKLIGFRLKKIQNKLESMIFKTSEDRIISFIKELAKEHGREIAGNTNEIEIRPKLTHEEIAKLTITSRQTVTTLLNELKKQDIISYNRSRIFIKQFDKL